METTAIATYQLREEFNRAAKSASRFIHSKAAFMKRSASKRSIISDRLKGKTSLAMAVAFPLMLLGLFSLLIFEMRYSEMVFSGVLDPNGSGQFSGTTIGILAIGMGITLLWFGHFVFHGRSERDAITGRFTTSLSSIFAAIAVLVIIGFQFLSAKVAVSEIESLSFIPWLIVGLSVIEFMAGGLILEKAISYMLMAVLSMGMWVAYRFMRKHARKTHENYTRYSDIVRSTGVNPQGSTNIREALLFYNDNEGGPDKIELIIQEPGRSTSENGQDFNQENTALQEVEQEVESVIEEDQLSNDATNIDEEGDNLTF